jgi:predicted dehydrogenase
MEKIKWGFIGCGDVTEVKSGPAFAKIPHSEVIAVMRRDAMRAEDYAIRHNIAKWYTDADQLINDPEINAIYIATPPSTHAYYTIKAAQAGKAVYVEKPMATSYAECMQMIEVCEKAGVPLFVAYYRRYLEQFLLVKKIIDNQIIGKIKYVNIKLLQPNTITPRKNKPWRVQKDIAGGGLFYDLASHQFDLLDFLLGKIVSASGQATNIGGFYDVEDTVTASFKFENGIVGQGLWCFVDTKETDCIEITGSEGKVRFPVFKNASVQLITEIGTEEALEPFPLHVQQPLIASVVAELTGKGKCNSTGISAARTNQVLEWIIPK